MFVNNVVFRRLDNEWEVEVRRKEVSLHLFVGISVAENEFQVVNI